MHEGTAHLDGDVITMLGDLAPESSCPPALLRPPLTMSPSATSAWLLNSLRDGDSPLPWTVVPGLGSPFRGLLVSQYYEELFCKKELEPIPC